MKSIENLRKAKQRLVQQMVRLKQELHNKHVLRHKELHKSFDELLADFIGHTGKLPSDTTLNEFMAWSYEQTINPTEENK